MAEETKSSNDWPEDLSSTTTPEERWALTWKLTVEEHTRRGIPIGEMDRTRVRVYRRERDASGKPTGRGWIREAGCERLASPEEIAAL